jgi:hypothetical protein
LLCGACASGRTRERGRLDLSGSKRPSPAHIGRDDQERAAGLHDEVAQAHRWKRRRQRLPRAVAGDDHVVCARSARSRPGEIGERYVRIPTDGGRAIHALAKRTFCLRYLFELRFPVLNGKIGVKIDFVVRKSDRLAEGKSFHIRLEAGGQSGGNVEKCRIGVAQTNADKLGGNRMAGLLSLRWILLEYSFQESHPSLTRIKNERHRYARASAVLMPGRFLYHG